jgi:hypothetical protein
MTLSERRSVPRPDNNRPQKKARPLGESAPDASGIAQEDWQKTPPPSPPILVGCLYANTGQCSAVSRPEFSANEYLA